MKQIQQLPQQVPQLPQVPQIQVPPMMTVAPSAAVVEMDHHIKSENDILLMEDSLDGGPSIGSDIVPSLSSPPPPQTISMIHPQHIHVTATPVTKKKEKEKKGKLVTGYILYSSEVRKDRAQSNPDCTFGDISRLVGNEWRSLPAFERQIWEEKAQKCNEENAIKFAEETGCPVSPAPAQSFFTAEPLPNQVNVFNQFFKFAKKEILVFEKQKKKKERKNTHISSQNVRVSETYLIQLCLGEA